MTVFQTFLVVDDLDSFEVSCVVEREMLNIPRLMFLSQSD